METAPIETPGEAVPTWKRVTGWLGAASGAGAWLSIPAALLGWTLSAVAFAGYVGFIFYLTEGGALDALAPGGGNNPGETFALIILMIIVGLITFVIATAVAFVLGAVGVLFAGGFHVLGVAASIGSIVAPGNHWTVRVAALPPLLLHGVALLAVLALLVALAFTAVTNAA